MFLPNRFNPQSKRCADQASPADSNIDIEATVDLGDSRARSLAMTVKTLHSSSIVQCTSRTPQPDHLRIDRPHPGWPEEPRYNQTKELVGTEISCRPAFDVVETEPLS